MTTPYLFRRDFDDFGDLDAFVLPVGGQHVARAADITLAADIDMDEIGLGNSGFGSQDFEGEDVDLNIDIGDSDSIEVGRRDANAPRQSIDSRLGRVGGSDLDRFSGSHEPSDNIGMGMDVDMPGFDDFGGMGDIDLGLGDMEGIDLGLGDIGAAVDGEREKTPEQTRASSRACKWDDA